jgi:hypothetical protein
MGSQEHSEGVGAKTRSRLFLVARNVTLSMKYYLTLNELNVIIWVKKGI